MTIEEKYDEFAGTGPWETQWKGYICEFAKEVVESNPIQTDVPYLKNRADGVDGHYCIAKKTAEGYHEFWNEELGKWCSTATVFKLKNI